MKGNLLKNNLSKQVTLYIGLCHGSGCRYFGKTTRYHTTEDLQKYYWGSGPLWVRHYSEFGSEVEMSVYWTGSESEVEEIALKFSMDNRIVSSPDWLNQKFENGLDGFPTNMVLVKSGDGYKYIPTEEFVVGDYKTSGSGKVLVKIGDKWSKVSTEEYNKDKTKYRHHSKGMVVVKWKDNRNSDGFLIDRNDKRYLSGELIPINYGLKHSEETKKHMKIGQSKIKMGCCVFCHHEAKLGATYYKHHDKRCDKNPDLLIYDIKCPYCCKMVKSKEKTIANMTRYHFDNCKLNPENKNNKIGISRKLTSTGSRRIWIFDEHHDIVDSCLGIKKLGELCKMNHWPFASFKKSLYENVTIYKTPNKKITMNGNIKYSKWRVSYEPSKNL